MRKVLLVIFSFCLALPVALAQLPNLNRLKTDKEKFDALRAYCDKMVEADHYDSVLLAARPALALAQKAGIDSLCAVFGTFMGNGFEYKPAADSAIKYYQVAEQYSIRTKHALRIVEAQNRILWIASGSKKAELTDAYQKKLEDGLKRYSDGAVVAKINASLAGVYTDKHEYEKALTSMLAALRYRRQVKDSTRIGTTLVNMSNLYLSMSNTPKALKCLQEAVPYLDKYPRAKLVGYFNMGGCYMNLEQHKKAETSYLVALGIAQKMADEDWINTLGVKLADIYIPRKQFERAEKMLLQALAYGEKVGDLHMQSDGYQTMGHLYAAKQDLAKATHWYIKALAISIPGKMSERTSEIYSNMADAAAKAGDYRHAYEYREKNVRYQDSLDKESNKEAISRLETQYQAERKEEQIKLLAQQQRAQALELQSQRRTKYVLFGGLALLVIIALLIYRSYRLKQNANLALEGKNGELESKNHELNTLNDKLDEANKSKTKLFSILSHDLRAPVSSLFQFLSLQKNAAVKWDDAQKLKHNERIIHSAENLMNSMEDLLMWSKSQMDTFKLQKALSTADEVIAEVIALHTDFARQRNITLIKDDAGEIKLDTDLNFLKIILRNITSNAIKFTPEGGRISFSAEAETEHIIFRITDEGVGMTDTQIAGLFEWNSIRSDTSGMGLRLAKEFTERLGGDIRVTSVVGKGTSFSLLLPVAPVVKQAVAIGDAVVASS